MDHTLKQKTLFSNNNSRTKTNAAGFKQYNNNIKMSIFRPLCSITKLLSNLNLKQTLSCKSSISQITAISFHTSKRNNDIMEFFEDKKHWPEKEIKVGRSWKMEELRIKSNPDLHKLWYILLKEKNMLLTMEHAHTENWSVMPNPERLDKVEESMENLEKVVRERNKAYWELETGETGERPVVIQTAFTGLRQRYRLRQHHIPYELNNKYQNFKKLLTHMPDKRYQAQFLSLYREKCWADRRKKKNRDFNHVCGLIKRFPNMDMAALREQYPDVDLEGVMKSRRIRGHRENTV